MNKKRKRPAPKQSTKKTTTRKRTPIPDGGRNRTAHPAKRSAATKEGCAAILLIEEHAGGERDEAGHAVAVGEAPPSIPAHKRLMTTAKGRRGRRPRTTVCRALAAAGHETRMKILAKLLEGPATYRAVQRVTKAPAGPLYHHINQLRLAGLILPKQRDLYELTRGGRNLVLTIAAMEPMIKDRRRRPVGR